MRREVSSMASAMFLIALLLSLLLGCSSLNHGDGDAPNNRVFSSESFVPKTVCSTNKGPMLPHTLVVTHRYGPCSPIRSHKQPSLHEVLRSDQLRVNYLHEKISKGIKEVQVSESKATLPALLGSALGTANYIVTVDLGTPPKAQTVVFDTGSNICWIQCQPCRKCYMQQQQIFDPSQSSSYRGLSCNVRECNAFHGNGCSGSECTYFVRYGDNSTTTGPVGSDVLKLGQTDVFMDFLFGCGRDNEGLFKGVAGLLGLGRDETSLVSQTSQRFGNVFSYCLPPTSSSTGYLNLGGSSTAVSGMMTYTPMLTNRERTYSISFTGIRVQGKLLPISPSVFTSVETIIDSGTVITRLPPYAYEELKSAFKSYMTAYPTVPGDELLDTCFDFSSSRNVSVPTIALHFGGGATVHLHASGILYPNPNAPRACLAFASDKGLGICIIGNVQQRTLEVVYDLGMKRIGFASGAC